MYYNKSHAERSAGLTRWHQRHRHDSRRSASQMSRAPVPEPDVDEMVEEWRSSWFFLSSNCSEKKRKRSPKRTFEARRKVKCFLQVNKNALASSFRKICIPKHKLFGWKKRPRLVLSQITSLSGALLFFMLGPLGPSFRCIAAWWLHDSVSFVGNFVPKKIM